MADRLEIGSVEGLRHLEVYADPSDLPLLDSLAATIGVRLPIAANTFLQDEKVTATWLGPDEWLVTAEGDASRTEGAIRQTITGAGSWGAVVDVSAAFVTLSLTGPGARTVLEAGCSIDLHPRSFAPGRCAQTLIARAPVILRQVRKAPAYLVMVRRSLADYLVGWLTDAVEGLDPPGA